MTDHIAFLERYVAALQAGDEQTVVDSFTDDASWTLRSDIPIGGVHEGRDAIFGEFFATAREYLQFGTTDLTPTSFTAQGDRVVMEWTSRATTASGAAYENECIGVFEFRDGRICAVREYMDTKRAAEVAFAAG